MNRSQRLLLAAGALRPLPVRNYAESRQWTPVEGIRGRLWVLSHPEHRLRQVQIPMDAGAPGFADAMLDVTTRLAEVEGRDLDEVLADLQYPDADTLRFRMVTAEAQGGQLPLADDISLREGGRRALLAAASSVVNPAPHHPRLSRSRAEQVVKSCLAGQTEHGSYVFKIVCPLNAIEDEPTLFDTEPFVRLTTRLLMEATSQLVSSIEGNRVDEFLKLDSTRPKLSWNLCDALMRMRPSGEGKLELSCNWAAVTGIAPPTDVPSRVTFPLEYFPEVERAARVLRPARTSDQVQMFVGTVESLEGTVGDDGRRAGDVVLSILNEEGEAVKARATLNPDQYAIADNAHMQGLGYVWLCGILRLGPRMGRIDKVSGFDLIGQADPSHVR